MVVTAVTLGVSIFATGLFSGMMGMLVFVMQLKWDRQSASAYVADIQPFLAVAKGHPLIRAVLFAGLLAPLFAALSLSGHQPGSAMLVLLGWLIFGAGVVGVTMRLNLPVYTALLVLDRAAPAADWRDLRRRFFHLNLTRMIASLIAFILFIIVGLLPPTPA